MSLLTKLRYVPKRFGVIAALAVAVTGTALTFAWGPDRPTFTVEQPAPYVTFNSITNNPVDGDERNFVRIKDASGNNWTDDIVIQPGKEYKVRMVVHNNAGENLNLKALNTTVKAAVPDTTGKEATITGFVGADNAQPKQVWDEVKLTSDKNFNLVYVAGSAKIWNQGYAKNGAALPDSIVTSNGTKIGYETAGDGIIPGCFQFLSYVEFTVKPQVQQTADFTLVKDVRKTGTTAYGQTASVKAGDTVDYRLSFKNTGEATLNNVMIKDALPTGMTYVSGTAKLQNANHQFPNTLALSSSLFAGGVNIGHYTKDANAFVTFQAKVNSNSQLPTCGLNTLKNVATAETDAGSVSDDAIVTVDKTCTTPPKEIQVCRLSDKKIVTIKESEFTTSKYSKDFNDCKTTQVPGKIQVCELATKKVITINETAFDAAKHSKDLNACKEEVTPPVTETPQVIAATGPEAILGGLIGSSALGLSISSYIRSRRALRG